MIMQFLNMYESCHLQEYTLWVRDVALGGRVLAYHLGMNNIEIILEPQCWVLVSSNQTPEYTSLSRAATVLSATMEMKVSFNHFFFMSAE